MVNNPFSTLKIIMVTCNRIDLTIKTIESLRKNGLKESILVVDNGSTDGTQKWLIQQDDVELITLPENMGISYAQKFAVDTTPAHDWYLFIDNDIELVTENFISNMHYVCNMLGDKYIIGASVVNIDPAFYPEILGYKRVANQTFELTSHVAGCYAMSALAVKQVLHIKTCAVKMRRWRGNHNYVGYAKWLEVIHIGEGNGIDKYGISYKF